MVKEVRIFPPHGERSTRHGKDEDIQVFGRLGDARVASGTEGYGFIAAW